MLTKKEINLRLKTVEECLASGWEYEDGYLWHDGIIDSFPSGMMECWNRFTKEEKEDILKVVKRGRAGDYASYNWYPAMFTIAYKKRKL